MAIKRLILRVHALQRMFERHISEDKPAPTLWEDGFRRRKKRNV
jgi:hypothetical protein